MSKRAVAIIVAGFFTGFVAFAIRNAYGLLLPLMIPSLGISMTGAGIIYSSYFIAYTVFAPLLGLLADRSDTRVLLTLFVVILGTGSALMSFSTTIIHASLFFALAGVGHSTCWVPVVAVVQRWVSEGRRDSTGDCGPGQRHRYCRDKRSHVPVGITAHQVCPHLQWGQESIMKVFITGGTGFVGNHVVSPPFDRGHQVKTLVRPESEHKLKRSG